MLWCVGPFKQSKARPLGTVGLLGSGSAHLSWEKLVASSVSGMCEGQCKLFSCAAVR